MNTIDRTNQTINAHTTQKGHSPLPWCVYEGDGFLNIGEDVKREFCNPHRGPLGVAELRDGSRTGVSRDQAMANARFVIRAANAYPALVEALRNLLTEAEGLKSETYMHDTELLAFKQAHEALALAGKDGE